MLPGETVDQFMARYRVQYERDHNIFCPHCNEKYEDEDYHHVSAWGEDPPKEATCGSCGEDFFVKERVERTWETAKSKDGFE